MNDQLSALRNIAGQGGERDFSGFTGNLNVTLITSGKGGVGKSVLSALFGMQFALSERVGVLDMDLQMADQDILFQVNPRYDLLDWVRDNRPVSSVLYPITEDLKLIAGVSGDYEALNFSDVILAKLKTAVQTFSTYMDHLLLDWGTGMWDMLLRFAPYTRRIIIVSDTTPTSMTDTYALIKLLEVAGVEREIFVLINRVETAVQGKIIFNKLQRVIQRFLQIQVKYAGSVRNSEALLSKLNQQVPITEAMPGEVGEDVRQIVKTILSGEGKKEKMHEFHSIRV